MANKDDFFRPSAKTESVPLPDGTTVLVRKLTADEVKTMQRSYMLDEAKQLDGLCYLMARCVVESDGRRVFEDSDAAKLAQGDYDVVETVAKAVLKFSGLRDPKAKSGA